jgi:regulation of enolase protein 1 (concanavalin A-like superfamily)
MSDKLTPANANAEVSWPSPKSFKLASPPKTDIYAAPAHGYVWTAPILYTKTQCASFKQARVTVSFSWTTVYDQGGLILAFPTKGNPNPDASNASQQHTHPKWVKAGIEINDGKPWASVVARENWADWSLSAPPTGVVAPGEHGTKGSVRAEIEFERHGDALFVYVQGPNGEGRSMIREPQWVFLDGRGDEEAWLGVYCCSPDPKGERNGVPLEVTFEDFVIVEQ